VSRGVVHVLTKSGDFTVSGLPWMNEGETRTLSPDGITAKCLCAKHNSAVSPLDSAARHYFSSLFNCFNEEAKQIRSIVSGHDIERWLLKTLRAFAVSRNLARGRLRLPGEFATEARFVEMLDDPLSWPDGAGLYCTMGPGDVTTNHARFRLQPLSNDRDEIAGVTVDMMGLVFVLRLEPPEDFRPEDAMYRPSEIVIRFPKVTHFIVLSWDASVRSGGAVTMRYTGRPPARNVI
jgi:hypothetical protein